MLGHAALGVSACTAPLTLPGDFKVSIRSCLSTGQRPAAWAARLKRA